MNTFADEMELFTLVSRKFKKIYAKQEQLRNFAVYDALVEVIALASSIIYSHLVVSSFCLVIKLTKITDYLILFSNFPCYQDISDSKIRSQGTYCTFKKESNWVPFLHIRYFNLAVWLLT